MAVNALQTLTVHDGVNRYDLWVEGGEAGIREVSQQPSSIFAAGGGPGRYGDAEPLFATNEQRTWEGGRGLEFFADDQTRYTDSKNAWTLTPGKIGPSPQWFFASNYRDTDIDMPGNMDWRTLFGGSRYIAKTFTASASYSADKVYLWIRRVGNPGTLTVELTADSAGDPGTAAQTVTVTTSDVTDYLSLLYPFDWSGTESLTGSTVYHIKAYGASTDDQASHWEVGVDVTGSASQYSSDNSTWTSASYSMYTRVVDADINVVEWQPFELDQQQYFVTKYTDGTASKVFQVGTRGKATAGAATTLTDTDASFGTSSEYDNALVKIIRGTGVGQIRNISSHTGTVLTVATWDINPDSTSEYIIYQTGRLNEVTEGTPALGTVTDVSVYNNIAMFAQGESDNIRRMRFNPGAATPAHEWEEDGTNKASKLATAFIAGTGLVTWRANNDTSAAGAVTVSRGTAVAWGGGHTFGTAIKVGNGDYPVTNLVAHDDTSGSSSRLWVLKTGEIGYIDTDKWYRVNVDISSFTEATNGLAALSHGLYLYFNWSWTSERLYGTALDDLDPNREAGIPSGRQGYISAMAAHPVGPIKSIDADTGTSSVMFFDNIGYHEIFRAWEAGKRIRSLTWQKNEGGKKFLWVACGDDLVYMEFPRNHRNPFADTTQKYMHEFSYESAIYDMGNSSIRKLFADVTAITQNLDGSGIYGEVDFQKDNDIGTSTWTVIDAGRFLLSPASTIMLDQGEVRQLKLRFRFYTNIATTPPIVNAIDLEGVGQLPRKSLYSMQVHLGDIAKKIAGTNPEFFDVVTEGQKNARIWTVERSKYKKLVGKKFMLQIPDSRPDYSTSNSDNLTFQLDLIAIR